MNKLYKLLFISIALVLTSLKGYSTHIIGGSLTYTHNGANSYTITLTMYRDCCPSCAAFPNNPVVNIYRGDGTAYTPASVTLATVSTTNITASLPPCATAPPTAPCAQQRIYSATVTIPPSPGGIHLEYDVCCRNNTISNIVNPGAAGETFYAYIPCYQNKWVEGFVLANGITADAGATAWTRAMGATPTAAAAVNAGVFEVTGANNGSVTWTSQVVNISAYTSGVNLSAIATRGGTMEAGDSLQFFYRLNGGALTLFPTNGQLLGNFATPSTPTATGLSGTTVQIVIRATYNNTSPNSEIYRWDMVSIFDNAFMPNSSPVFGTPPPLYLCALNAFNINYSATDADGDSLVYTMMTPYSDAPAITFPENTATIGPVTWNAGYSATSPFNSGGPGVTLNSVTGMMTGVANSLGQFVFGVKCSEYRTGRLISETVRDYQANVVTCPPFVPTTPTASTTNPSPVCTGQTLNLTASSPDVGVTYNWTGPNGFTSTLQNPTIPSVTVAASGTYSVTATVSGCTSVAGTITITVNPTPASPTAGSNSPVCVGSTLNLTASVVAGATYNWTGPNSFSSTTQNPSIAGITTAGAGTYSVTATSAAGCISTFGTTAVVVNPTPTAPTAGSNSPVCVGATINLTASNIASATYNWTGPNSFSSTTQNPSIAGATALMAGTYSVTATVGGCVSAFGTVTVTINPIPTTPTAGSNSPVCVGATINLTANNIVGATYNWTGPNSFSSTTQNPAITGATALMAGTYSVTATVGGCVSAFGTTAVVVNPTPAAPTAGSNSPVCVGATINLTASTVVGATYNWTGPNSFSSTTQNPSIAGATALMAGTYSVTATVGGCVSAFGTTAVIVSPVPATPSASSNSAVCQGATLNLTASNVAGATYTWTGPNSFSSSTQNPSIAGVTLAAAGTYSVTATVAGCTGAAGTTLVVVNPTPTAPTAGSNTPLCVGNTLNLTSSTVAGATYNWTGPNSFSSSTQNPSIANITLAGAGTYSVTATVAGCGSANGTTTVVVNPIPAAPTAGSNSPICNGGTINLTASIIAGATYSWTGPNGFTSALQNPSIAGAAPIASGTYSVTATVNGCTSVFGTTNVVVNLPPAAPTAGSNTPVCTGTPLNLTANLIAGATYSWTGPNGFTSALQNPTIASTTLLAAGTYSVTATVPGCVTSPVGTTTVVVNATPVAPTAGSNTPVCENATLNLTANFIAGATYNWTGPNGFTASTQNPSIAVITAAGAGTYSVSVTVNGCTGAAGTTTVTVLPTPATPSPSSNSPLCIGATINLSTTAVAGATYNWTGPNGFTSTLQNPSISGATLAADGTYSLTVTVGGCTSTAGTVVVTVNSLPATPTAGSNTPVCTGAPINLTANTIAGATYSWTGPNGFTSTLQNPTVSSAVLASAGTYTVVANNGCASSPATTVVVVNATPATPSVSNNGPLCVGATLNLTTPLVAGATYAWAGPNGFTSSLQNPSISNVTITEAGTYSVTITVNSCTSNAGNTNVVVNIIPPPPSTASSNSPVCQGTTLNLTASSVAGATYNWTGPNGFTASTQNPTIPSVLLLAAGTYSVTATVSGCTSPSAATTTVVVNPTPTAPTALNNGALCEGNTLNLSASTVGGATYNWTGPNGFISSSQNPSISNVTVADAGTYSVTATENGCTGPAGTTVVTIHTIPVISTIGSNSPICVGATLNLTTGNITGATFSWTGPNGFISSSQNPSITNTTVADAGTYSLTVTVNGCTSAVSTVNVSINTAPATPLASANSPVCTTDTLFLNVSTVSGAVYSWTGPNGFTSALQNPFIANITSLAAGTYTVVANNGCSSSPATTTVVVNPKPLPPTATNNSAICEGGNLNLNASTVAGATYSWTGPNSYSSSNQNNTITGATATNAGTYSVTVTANGCTSNPATTTVIINSLPIADAGTNQTVCANNAFVLLNGSVSGGTTTGIWSSSGTGTFSPVNTDLNASYSPSNADTTAGSVILTLTSTNNGACAASVSSITITITDSPIANAGLDQSVCANNAAVTLNGSISVATGGIWYTSGDGTFSPSTTDLNATYTPGANDLTGGTITLTLATTGNGTCIADSSQMIVTITGSPTANAGTDLFVCKSSPNTTLNGIVTGSPTGVWTTLGSGSFSPSATNLNATYIPSTVDTAAGSVILILTTTNNGGCNAVTDTIVITYTDIPVVIAGSNQTVCANNALVTLSGSVTIGSTTGIWSTSGSGTFTPSATALNAIYTPSAADNSAGTVTLTLSSTNACVVITDNLTLTITPAPVVDAGSNLFACANNADANYSATITGGSSSGIWTSNGTGTFTPSTTSLNGTYISSAADIASGSVMLILTSDNNGNCLAVADTTILTITPPPIVFAGNDTSFCANTTLTLNGSLTGGTGTIVWTTSGSGTFAPDDLTFNATYIPSAADTALGSVTLTITSTNNGGCLASVDQLIAQITDAPTIFAGADQIVCANNPDVSLNASVTIASGVQWTTLGDGTFASSTALSTTYTPGINDIAATSITLVATTTGNGTCIPVTDTIVIQVSPAPIVNAGSNIFICEGITTANLNGSVAGATTTGIWATFGSGTFSLDTDLNATYNLSTADTAAGNVMLVLTSTNNGNCNAVSDTVSIIVTTEPITFAGNDILACANNINIVLSGTVTGGSGQGQWTTSGSGTFTPSDTTLNATYVASAADINSGSITLTLTPMNSCNPVADMVIVTIGPAPIVNAGVDTTICGSVLPIVLAGSMDTIATGAIWTTNGAGTFSPNNTTLNAIYTPDVSDNDTLYFVLTTTGNGLCNAVNDTMYVFRNIMPTAAFTVSNSCEGQTVQFNDASNANGGTINSWSWNFGSGTSVQQNPTFTFGTQGTYTVSLIVSSGLGCTDSVTTTIAVNPLPTTSFTFVANCLNEPVLFNSSSSANVVSWNWNFGDSTSSILSNPAHLFDSAGVYSVMLTVTSDSGCTANTVQTITLNPMPNAGLLAQTNCTSLTVIFADTSSTTTSWSWDFGDGTGTSTQQNPTYTYSSSGTYTVTLIVQSATGCADTAVTTVTTGEPVFADYIPNGGTYNVNQTINFTNQSTGAFTYSWDFGDGSQTSTDENPSYVFSSPGNYSVVLVSTNTAGCSDSVNYLFTINSIGYATPTGFTPNGDGINDYFYILGNFSDYELRVFNEWGNQLFISNNQSDKWDGTYKGAKQPAGTYIYIFNGKIVDGDDLKLNGEINLIR